MHHDHVGFILGIQLKSINWLHHINKLKDKSHTIVSKETEKECRKIQHLFMTNVLNELGIKENLLNLIKGIFEKTQANILKMVKD